MLLKIPAYLHLAGVVMGRVADLHPSCMGRERAEGCGAWLGRLADARGSAQVVAAAA
jgi:hypothetical protein